MFDLVHSVYVIQWTTTFRSYSKDQNHGLIKILIHPRTSMVAKNSFLVRYYNLSFISRSGFHPMIIVNDDHDRIRHYDLGSNDYDYDHPEHMRSLQH